MKLAQKPTHPPRRRSRAVYGEEECDQGFALTGKDYRGHWPWVLERISQLVNEAIEGAEDALDTSRWSVAYRMAADQLDRKRGQASRYPGESNGTH